MLSFLKVNRDSKVFETWPLWHLLLRLKNHDIIRLRSNFNLKDSPCPTTRGVSTRRHSYGQDRDPSNFGNKHEKSSLVLRYSYQVYAIPRTVRNSHLRLERGKKPLKNGYVKSVHVQNGPRTDEQVARRQKCHSCIGPGTCEVRCVLNLLSIPLPST